MCELSLPVHTHHARGHTQGTAHRQQLRVVPRHNPDGAANGIHGDAPTWNTRAYDSPFDLDRQKSRNARTTYLSSKCASPASVVASGKNLVTSRPMYRNCFGTGLLAVTPEAGRTSFCNFAGLTGSAALAVVAAPPLPTSSSSSTSTCLTTKVQQPTNKQTDSETQGGGRVGHKWQLDDLHTVVVVTVLIPRQQQEVSTPTVDGPEAPSEGLGSPLSQ